MKSLVIAVIAAFALPLFAIPAHGPQECSRCIKSCQREKDDASAEACLSRCLKTAACNQMGFSGAPVGLELLLDTREEAKCALDQQNPAAACAVDQSL